MTWLFLQTVLAAAIFPDAVKLYPYNVLSTAIKVMDHRPFPARQLESHDRIDGTPTYLFDFPFYGCLPLPEEAVLYPTNGSYYPAREKT
jgi:hypothetical protein